MGQPTAPQQATPRSATWRPGPHPAAVPNGAVAGMAGDAVGAAPGQGPVPDHVVCLGPLKGPRDRSRTVILTLMVIGIAVEFVLGILSGGENRWWSLGLMAVFVALFLLLVKRQSLEFRAGAPWLVNRWLVGWRSSIPLDAGTTALVRTQQGLTWIGVRRGHRGIWVQVMSRDTLWNAEAPPATRAPEELEALAFALRGCLQGHTIAAALTRHVAAVRAGVPVTQSPLWADARSR